MNVFALGGCLSRLCQSPALRATTAEAIFPTIKPAKVDPGTP